MLTHIPLSLWTTHPHDVGHVPQHQVTVKIRHGVGPVWRPQYRLRPEQTEGIKNMIDGLLEAGVILPTRSPWNTPLLPVPKAGGRGWRMVHDLRAINDATESTGCPVPDPYLALQNLNPSHKFFTVIDLANAFFCLPLDPDSQAMFAFTYQRQQYTYSRMPQGFRDSPGIFNRALKQDLQDMTWPEGTMLLQYVDDLLLAAPNITTCLQATHALLCQLATNGYKVNKDKVQVCRRNVTFFGRMISANSVTLTNSQRTSILNHGQPTTVQQMLGLSRSHWLQP